MAFLKVKDPVTGNFKGIPAIKGDPGPQGPKGDPGETTGDVSEAITIFTESDERTNISTGETIKIIFGKIKKWFSDLKTVAFTGSYNDLADIPESLPADGGNADTVDNKHAYDFMSRYNAGAVTTFDTFIDAGVYRIQEISEEAGVPIGFTQYGQLLVLNGDNSDTITQIYCNFDNNKMFSRSCHEWGKDPSNWTEWEKVNSSFDMDAINVTNADDAPDGISTMQSGGVNNPFVFHSTLMTFKYGNYYKQQIAFPWRAGESQTIKYRVKDNDVWYEWKNLNDGEIALSLYQEDKRSENNTPEWYWTHYPMRVVNEFKSGSVIGLPLITWLSVETRIPWTDVSGGVPIQIARFEGFEFIRYGIDATTWSDWVESVKTISSGAIYGRKEHWGTIPDEGGQIVLEQASTSTLGGDFNIDVVGDRIRFFAGGYGKGAFLDIGSCSPSVGDRILTSKNVAVDSLAPTSPQTGDIWIW